MGGQGVNVFTQLLIPPIFLRHYNIAAYGEWLTLTATVSYLGTLNFGLQTFANNQVAISYNRGDVEEAKTLQATAFSILLGIIGLAALVTAFVFLVPINHWLGLKTSHAVVAASIYLLGLQILTKMIFGFLGGTFLVIGVSYRGTNWNNAQALVSMLGTAVLAVLHTSFAWIAAQQLINVAVFCILILFDLRMKAPDVFPAFDMPIADALEPSSNPAAISACSSAPISWYINCPSSSCSESWARPAWSYFPSREPSTPCLGRLLPR